MNILIVEDDDSVARFLKQAVTEAGYTAQVAGDGLDALQLAQAVEFNLILLDVMLPRMNGFEITRRLREQGNRVLILLVTAKDTLENKIEGLDAGADDYIVKPFQVAELLARMRALLRRSDAATPVLSVSDLTLNPATRQAHRAGRTIDLSATEYALLEYLMRHAGRVVTRAMILNHVWQYDFAGNDNVLDVYISYLRRKIDKGQARPLIHTAHGTGFRISADPQR